MNNKMTLYNFLNAGGVIEVRLQRDLMGLGLKPEELFAGANSIETAKELVDKMDAAEMFVRPMFFNQMQDVRIDMFVESICLTWNRTQYSFNGGWRMLRHAIIDVWKNKGDMYPFYLDAVGKSYL